MNQADDGTGDLTNAITMEKKMGTIAEMDEKMSAFLVRMVNGDPELVFEKGTTDDDGWDLGDLARHEPTALGRSGVIRDTGRIFAAIQLGSEPPNTGLINVLEDLDYATATAWLLRYLPKCLHALGGGLLPTGYTPAFIDGMADTFRFEWPRSQPCIVVALGREKVYEFFEANGYPDTDDNEINWAAYSLGYRRQRLTFRTIARIYKMLHPKLTLWLPVEHRTEILMKIMKAVGLRDFGTDFQLHGIGDVNDPRYASVHEKAMGALLITLFGRDSETFRKAPFVNGTFGVWGTGEVLPCLPESGTEPRG